MRRAISLLGTLGSTLVLAAGAVMLSGCSANFNSLSTAGAKVPIGTIKGVTYGGQAPIVGAQVYLFAVGNGAYGGGSVSLLSGTGTSDNLGSYVVTDSNGQFNITGDYTCTTGQVLYLYSINGSPGIVGGGSYGLNTAAGLMATLGVCPSSGTFSGVNAIPYVYMNEVSTLATAYSFAGYATDAVDIGVAPGVGSTPPTPTALAETGLTNAALNATQLYDISGSTSATGARTVTAAGNGTVPYQLINALANVLAACVNSSGNTGGAPSSSACVNLFNNLAVGPGGVKPTNTATAAVYIAKNPGNNVSAIFGLAPDVVFTPFLGTTPNDFTVAITYTASGVSHPLDVEIDASGDAWVTTPSTYPASGLLTKFSPLGVATSYAEVNPAYIAIDNTSSGYVWTTAPTSYDGTHDYEYSEPNSGGTATSYLTSFPTPTSSALLMRATGLANDGSTNSFTYIADTGNNRIVQSQAGAATAQVSYSASGYTASLNFLAIDSSGYLWTTEDLNGYVCRQQTDFSVTLGSSSCQALNKPERIALDVNGIAWVPDFTTSTLYKFKSGPSIVAPTSGTGGGLNSPYGVAIDGLGLIWVANSGTTGSGAGSISEFKSTTTGVATVTGGTGYTSGLASSVAHKNLAIDGSGDIWLANSGVGSGGGVVTEIIGIASPVVTPISYGVFTGTLGSQP